MEITMYNVTILADSVAPNGCRLFTVEATYPRFIHSEVMTHRQFSRNAASSRAIPIERVIAAVRDRPAAPCHWGANQRGMQASEELTDQQALAVRREWLRASGWAVNCAQMMSTLGAHKQIANRILEPFVWMTTILSTTDWANFFALRCDPAAQPEFQEIANRLCYAYTYHEPTLVPYGEWHLPLIKRRERQEFSLDDLRRLSTARCARVSYLTHDGVRDPQADFDLHDRLAISGRWSPFEHVATPTYEATTRCANFQGWKQYRRCFMEECRSTYPIPAPDARKAWRCPPAGAPFDVWDEAG
jgi:hypothetical protein